MGQNKGSPRQDWWPRQEWSHVLGEHSAAGHRAFRFNPVVGHTQAAHTQGHSKSSIPSFFFFFFAPQCSLPNTTDLLSATGTASLTNKKHLASCLMSAAHYNPPPLIHRRPTNSHTLQSLHIFLTSHHRDITTRPCRSPAPQAPASRAVRAGVGTLLRGLRRVCGLGYGSRCALRCGLWLSMRCVVVCVVL